MPYVASAGVTIDKTYPLPTDGKWVDIKNVEGIEYRWRVKDDTLLQAVAGIFTDGKEALSCAKKMYVNLIYAVMALDTNFGKRISPDITSPYIEELHGQWTEEEYYDDELYFYYDEHNKGGLEGPAVLEVRQSIDEADEYPNIVMEVTVQWDSPVELGGIDGMTFPCTEETLPILSVLVDASMATDQHLMVTQFTCVLEHLVDEKEKSPELCAAIDELVESLAKVELDGQEKEQITNCLLNFKREGGRNKVRRIAAEHARESYGGHKTRDIVNKAYDVRSAYAHGGHETAEKLETARFVRFVAMDVARSILMERYAQ